MRAFKKKNARKSLELEGPSKEESEEMPQPSLKDDLPKDQQFKKYHPQDLIISDTTKGVTNYFKLKSIVNLAFISQIEPKNIEGALNDEFWVLAMQEELNQFERNKVWTLVLRPKYHPIIGTKWLFRNKINEQGVIPRNKARLAAKGYNQEEGIDYDETFSPVVRLEAIRMLLVFASFMDFKLY